MSSKTATPVRTLEELSEAELAILDRAVRTSRGQYWCERFEEFGPGIFNIAEKDLVDSDGYSCRGIDRNGFNKQGFDRNGYNKDGRDKAGFDQNGLDVDGFDRQGMNAEGKDRQGRDKYRFDQNGYDIEGFGYDGRRYRGDRAWYAAQALKTDEELSYDRYGDKRPEAKIVATDPTQEDEDLDNDEDFEDEDEELDEDASVNA